MTALWLLVPVTQVVLKLVATTSTLSVICSEVAGGRAEVVTISPGAACPGHFDLGAREAANIASGDLLLYQGWEPWLSSVTRIIGPEDRRLIRLEGPKDLMVPPVHARAATQIAAILAKADPGGAEEYARRAVTYRTEVEHHAAAIRRRCEGASVDTVRVICSAWQEPFLTWMGYEVVATYGPPDQATAARAAALADVAKDIDVVVDNLQSGPPAGQALARDVGARHVVLTNFVLGSNYLEALEANVDTLLGEADN